MKKPPKTIDGASVLEWAWSGVKPFGVIPCNSGGTATDVFGLAICKYPNSDEFYRFSCNSAWECEQDSKYSSASEAKENLPTQYQLLKAIWQIYE